MTDRKTTPAIDANITRLNTSNPCLSLTFSNGQGLYISQDMISEAVAQQALMHGLKQKLVDAAAISRDPKTGRPATIETKYLAVREVYDRLLSGEWNKRREGGAGASGGLLFRALVRMYDGKKTPDDIREFLDGKTDAEKAQLRKNPRVAAMIEEIRAESAKDDGTAGEDLLADLE